ncbi:zinc finger X-linked protein ZXDB-like [Prunus yedoensis var. nudiflora]|uniref:Zinc finger X-linked protein ZXDB-like n=1 Tax=Prunus yedoensis var. nudiflora TaxID=2094558 RepID=A0A314XJ07_PRUYE|nr:zinc finger X-linked protein ZXDB-like [Prunus yedoensis var. nudiflora]
MAESTQAIDERNKGIVETESMESSTEYPFERLEKAMREGFQTMTTSMTDSMNHMSQSIVQTVERGHANTTLQGNETRAHLSQVFERIIRMAQEEDAPRKDKGLLENENASSGVPKYSSGQTNGHANSTSPKMIIGSSYGTPFQVVHTGTSDMALAGPVATQASSPSKEPGGHWCTPSGTSAKYQAPRTGEAALPPGPVRKNMYAERWKEPAGFNVHIAHNNGNNGGNRRARRDFARTTEPPQDSDDEDEAG